MSAFEVDPSNGVKNARRVAALLELRDTTVDVATRDAIYAELYAYHEALMKLTGEQLTWSQLEDGWRRQGRATLDEVIGNGFPDGTLDTFYSERTGLAVVEGSDGNLYRVWPDGDGTEIYKR